VGTGFRIRSCSGKKHDPEWGYRFSDTIMPQAKDMIPKSGNRFSDKIMLQAKSMIPK